ncbi:MAG: hypothetical protein O2794_02680 [bacterium]|nr:hypothetical protein [bacterium]
MKNIIVVIILAGAAYGVYAFALPSWEQVQIHRAEISSVDAIQADVQEILEKRDSVLERYKASRNKQEQLDRLEKLIPPVSDREDLYLFFQKIVVDSGMKFNGVKLNDASSSTGVSRPTITFSMKVDGPYEKMRLLLDIMENNLRIMDISALGFEQDEDGDFNLSVTGLIYYGN